MELNFNLDFNLVLRSSILTSVSFGFMLQLPLVLYYPSVNPEINEKMQIFYWFDREDPIPFSFEHMNLK